MAVPADFEPPDDPVVLQFWVRGGRWWCPDFDPR
jgi:hypothetical protein